MNDFLDGVIGIVMVLGIIGLGIRSYFENDGATFFIWILLPAILIGLFLSIRSLRRAYKSENKEG